MSKSSLYILGFFGCIGPAVRCIFWGLGYGEPSIFANEWNFIWAFVAVPWILGVYEFLRLWWNEVRQVDN